MKLWWRLAVAGLAAAWLSGFASVVRTAAQGQAPASTQVRKAGEVFKNVTTTALKDEHFFILPHPVVGEFYRRKGDDHDRWLNGMQRLQARVEEATHTLE